MTTSQTVLRFAKELKISSKGFLKIFFVNQFIHHILKFYTLMLHSIYLKSLSREYFAQIMPTSMSTDIGWICTTEFIEAQTNRPNKQYIPTVLYCWCAEHIGFWSQGCCDSSEFLSRKSLNFWLPSTNGTHHYCMSLDPSQSSTPLLVCVRNSNLYKTSIRNK